MLDWGIAQAVRHVLEAYSFRHESFTEGYKVYSLKTN